MWILTSIINMKLSNTSSLNKKYHIYFLDSLANLLTEGFSLNQAIEFVTTLLPSEVVALEALNQIIQQGHSLEEGLKQLGFSSQLVAQLFYGQRQGRLIEALQGARNQLQKQKDYRQSLIKAIVYPLFMSLFLIAMLFAMRSFMLPQLVGFISPETYQKHLMIRVLILFFTFLPHIFSVIFAIILISYLLFDFYIMRLPYIQRYRLIIKIPFLKIYTRKYITFKLTRELAHFYRGGYSLQQIIDLLISYPIDPFLTEMAHQLANVLGTGESLSTSLNQLGLFTTELSFIIQQGEATSQIGPKCQMYAERLQAELIESLQKILAIIQPCLFILIAMLIIAMYLVMMLPMLTMEGL